MASVSQPESLVPLIDALERDDIRHAQSMTLRDRLLAGPRLFERACWLMSVGFRNQFPDANEEQISRMVDEQLARMREPEEEFP